MSNSLSFKFHKNPSCLKLSRTLLKNDDTLLEFRRTWRFLTGAGVHDHVFMCFFDENKLKFHDHVLMCFFDDNKLKFQVS